MAFQEYEVGGLKVKSSRTRAEFQAAIENWQSGRGLDDSDFRELWRAYPAGQKLRLILAAEKDYYAGLPKRLNGEKRAEFMNRLDKAEEKGQNLFQKEARIAFAQSLPDQSEKDPARESELYWQKWGGGEDPEVWQ